MITTFGDLQTTLTYLATAEPAGEVIIWVSEVGLLRGRVAAVGDDFVAVTDPGSRKKVVIPFTAILTIEEVETDG